MMNQDNNKKYYKDTVSKLHASEDLREAILNLPEKKNVRHLSAFVKAVIIAAAVIFSFGISNLITWAASGTAWIVTVSNDLFNAHVEKLNEHYPALREDSFSESDTAEESVAELEDILSQMSIETYPADEAAATAENYEPGDIVVKDDLTDGQLDALWDNYQKTYEQEVRNSCDEAVEKGYVYLFEMILEYDEEWGLPLHKYRYIKSFSPEELEGAQFNADYEWIKIQGENYHVMVSHVGDFKELDAGMPDLDWETRILRVFTEENYKEQAEIKATEGLEYIKKNLAIPIYEGRVAVYSNEDDSLIRTFTEEECHNAEISENFQVVRIAGELYMVTYKIADDHKTTEEIRLRSPESYKGDAKTEGIEQYNFNTMADFNIGN